MRKGANKESRSPTRFIQSLAMLLALLVLYTLSIGPVAWMIAKIGIGSWEAFNAAYAPLWSLFNCCGMGNALEWYLDLWINPIHG
jgi:hypothetical protein